MIHVFDLDGVLIDSREAVEKSYEEAGLVGPVGWGKRAEDWCDLEIHRKKCSLYPEVLKVYGREGPLFQLYRTLCKVEPCYVATSASASAVRAVEKFLGVGFELLTAEADSMNKRLALMTLQNGREDKLRGYYYDDLIEHGREVTAGTRFRLVVVP